MKALIAALVVLLASQTFGLPLPSAYLPVSPRGPAYGNASQASVIAEINTFSARLLKDPVSYIDSHGATKAWPWKRLVLQVSSYNATANDGLDDWTGIYNAVNDACSRSQTIYSNYLTQLQNASAGLPPLLSGPDDRPVLVELQFTKNGVYDLGHGIWLPPVCRYVLLNGQNCTIVTHFEATFQSRPIPDPSNYIWWDTQQLFSCPDNWCANQPKGKYALNFNMKTFLQATTAGVVVAIQMNATGSVYAFDIQALPLHPAFSESDYIYYNHLDVGGGFANLEPPFALYGGYKGNVSLVPGTTPEQIGGKMRIWISDDDLSYIGTNVQIGQWFGVKRGWMLYFGGGLQVVQGVNSMYTASGYSLSDDADIIDCHQDRLNHALYMEGGVEGPVGQTSSTGRFRYWHSSAEGGSDDDIDNLSGVSDVIAVDFSRKAIQLRVTGGRWAPATGMCPQIGTLVELGHYPDLFNPYVTLTVASCYQNSSQLYSWIFFNQNIPAQTKVGDVACSLAGNPVLLHFKNYRGGNHIYNLLNIKAQTILIEQSFMYNTTMACVDISTDAGYWYEGARVANLIVQNNVFYGCFSSIQTSSYGLHGRAPSATNSLTIADNWFYQNSTTAQGDWFPHTSIDLAAISNFSISSNRFYLVPGMRNNLPLINLCNAHNGTILNNVVTQSSLIPNMGGSSCDGSFCPSYPLASAVQYSIADGCLRKYSYGVSAAGNSFTSIVPLNSLSVVIDLLKSTYNVNLITPKLKPQSPALVSKAIDNNGLTVYNGALDMTSGRTWIDFSNPSNGLTAPTAALQWGSSELTIEMFVLPTAYPYWTAWFSSANWYANEILTIYQTDNNQIGFQHVHNGWDNYTQVQGTIPGVGSWTHVALVVSNVVLVGPYDGLSSTSVYQLYINGILANSVNAQIPPALVDRSWYSRLGNYDLSWPANFTGYFKSINFLPYAYSAQQMNLRYHRTLGQNLRLDFVEPLAVPSSATIAANGCNSTSQAAATNRVNYTPRWLSQQTDSKSTTLSGVLVFTSSTRFDLADPLNGLLTPDLTPFLLASPLSVSSMTVWVQLTSSSCVPILTLIQTSVSVNFTLCPTTSTSATLTLSISSGSTKFTISSPTAFALNEWHHFGYSVNKTNGFLFADGSLLKTAAGTSLSVSSTTKSLLIGGSFNGYISSTWISAASLSSGNVSSRFSAGPTPKVAGTSTVGVLGDGTVWSSAPIKSLCF